jgi:hypothetical protein
VNDNRVNLPLRRLIACVGIVVFLILYVLAVVSLAGLIHGGPITALIFYALAGTLWGLPLIPLIAWSENYKGRKKK